MLLEETMVETVDEAPAVDLGRIERAVREILAAVVEDPTREGLVETPRRVARMWSEMLAGYRENPAAHLAKTFDVGCDELVLVKDIAFSSTCEHHMLPFTGHAHIAYLPGADGRVTGLSKLARLVEGFARRLQVQERMTAQIADALAAMLQPAGVLVVVEAAHSCMALRGIRKTDTSTITTAVRGVYRTDACARGEVLGLIR
jgi:GTP cyclohydrolase IA